MGVGTKVTVISSRPQTPRVVDFAGVKEDASSNYILLLSIASDRNEKPVCPKEKFHHFRRLYVVVPGHREGCATWQDPQPHPASGSEVMGSPLGSSAFTENYLQDWCNGLLGNDDSLPLLRAPLPQ
ncbi:hypothetical protein NPIL_298781 [Nephila pilipes]|uniref:Uncharacterized protein n=1 Tax=Nephila pilipes TaxID=299642 RepID=A0A8X6QMY8_NEPPI|nr:hypothetical protein NPIL_298781 [Nephila pilipes]